MAQVPIVSHKLVLLGDSGVGKSSLVIRYVKEQFYEFQESTIGAAFLTRTLDLGEYKVKFEIWDTAGQERYHSLAPMYYRGAAAGIVVYDITDEASFERAKAWIQELQREGSPNILIALAGNKVDLEPQRKVSVNDAKQCAVDNGLLFTETSAKTDQNVAALFETIAQRLPKPEPDSNTRSWAGVLDPDMVVEEPKGGCC